MRLRSHGRASKIVLGLIGVVVLACNHKPDPGSGSKTGSPSAGGAGREGASQSRAVEGTSTTGNAALARSLVAVAATSPGEAQPCERTCGRVGDCLLETGDSSSRSEFEASRLELECLDLCVHSVESDPTRSAFLACEQQSSCGELLGCARSNWDALAANRVGPTVQGVTGSGNACEGCRWMYSCMITGMPPGQAYMDPVYEESIRSCEATCESISPQERETYQAFSDCLRSNCSPDRQHVCWDY
jgi:hypothetical protein